MSKKKKIEDSYIPFASPKEVVEQAVKEHPELLLELAKAVKLFNKKVEKVSKDNGVPLKCSLFFAIEE